MSRYCLAVVLAALVAGSSGVCAQEHIWDFSSEADGAELHDVERLRRFHPVPGEPDVKISMPDPTYRKYKEEPAGFGYFGQLVKLADGTLVASFDERVQNRSHYGTAGGRRVTRVSTDGGKSWGPPQGSVGNCGMPDGSMWGWTAQQEGKWVVPTYVERASKPGTPLEIPFEGPFPAMPKLVLSNGDVIFEVHDRPGVGVREGYFRKGNLGPGVGPKGGAIRSIVISDTKLSKWEEVTLEAAGYLRDEFSITETKIPGRLVMLARNQSLSNYYYQAISRDYGRTWEDGRPSGVWFSGYPSRPFVMTLSDGTVLAMNGERANRRMIATPSLDNGSTWELGRRIVICDSPKEFFTDGDFSYPDGAEIEPGRVLVRYYTSVVRDITTQWGVWGNFLDTTYITRPYRGVRLAVDAGEGDSAPLARWSFEDDQETAANEEVASNYGRVYGGKRVPGRFGRGLWLAGGDSKEFVEVVDSPAMRVGNAFAIELFFKAKDTSRQQGLVSKRPFYYLGIRDGLLVFEIGDPSGKRSRLFYAVTGKTKLKAGRWYHAAAVTGIHWDGYRKMHVFLDGEPEVDVRGWERTYPPSVSHVPREAQARTTAEAAAIIDLRPESGPRFWNTTRMKETRENLLIGADCIDSPADFFCGVIDEVVLHGEYLYPSDIKALAKRGYCETGEVLSPVIQRKAGEGWARFWAEAGVPRGTLIAFSVLDAEGETLKASIKSGADLADLHADAIRLKAELSTRDPLKTPVLWEWAIRREQPKKGR